MEWIGGATRRVESLRAMQRGARPECAPSRREWVLALPVVDLLLEQPALVGPVAEPCVVVQSILAVVEGVRGHGSRR